MSANFPSSIVTVTMEIPLAGCSFRAGHHDEMRRYLGGDYRLELWPEPENPHDRGAVRVMFVAQPGALHLGYIPRMDAPFVLAAIHLGREIKVSFKDVGTTPGGDPYATIAVEIGVYQAPQPPAVTPPAAATQPTRPYGHTASEDQPF